jgi:hypothetical protein
MRKGRFHCVVGPVMDRQAVADLHEEFVRKKKWLPTGTLVAPILQLTDRYDCPHRFSLGKGRHYCTSTCFLKHFVPREAAGAGVGPT